VDWEPLGEVIPSEGLPPGRSIVLSLRQKEVQQSSFFFSVGVFFLLIEDEEPAFYLEGQSQDVRRTESEMGFPFPSLGTFFFFFQGSSGVALSLFP